MKKLTIIALSLIAVLSLNAQESDTTQLEVRGKKIIIVDRNSDQDEVKAEFQEKIEEHKQEIVELKTQLEALKAENAQLETEAEHAEVEKEIAKLESQIKEEEKKISALEKGISDLEDDDDLSSLKDKMNDKLTGNGSKKSNFKRQKKFESHWGGFLIGYNTLINADYSMDLSATADFMQHNQSQSYEAQLNIMDLEIPFTKKMGLASGIGFQWNHYRLNTQNLIVENADGIIEGVPTQLDHTEHMLNTMYFNIPLLLEIQLGNRRNGFYIHGGGYVGVKMDSYIHEKYTENNVNVVKYSFSDYQISPFHYGYFARMGYRFISIYGTVSKSKFFNDKKGPELYTASVGLGINF